jgi:hypothetical protein
MATIDLFYLAGTVFAVLGAGLVGYNIYITAKAEARSKTEHEVRMAGYAHINTRTTQRQAAIDTTAGWASDDTCVDTGCPCCGNHGCPECGERDRRLGPYNN